MPEDTKPVEEPPQRHKECGVMPPRDPNVKFADVAVIPAGKSCVVILPTDQVKKELDLPLKEVPAPAEK